MNRKYFLSLRKAPEARPRDRRRKRALLRVGMESWHLSRAEAVELKRQISVYLERTKSRGAK